MLKLARWCSAHRRLVVVAWIVVFVGALGLSSAVGTNYGNSFFAPGHRLPAGVGPALERLSRPGRATSTRSSSTRPAATSLRRRRGRASRRSSRRVARLPHVDSVVSPYSSGARAISRDGTIGFATVDFDERANVVPVSAVERVVDERAQRGARRRCRSSSADRRSSRPPTGRSATRSRSGSARRSWCC